MLGVKRRAPTLVRPSPAVSSLLPRIAQHAGHPDAKIERTWPSTQLKELDLPKQGLLLWPRQDKSGSVLPCNTWYIYSNKRPIEHLREL